MADADLVDVYVARRMVAAAAGGDEPMPESLMRDCCDLRRVHLRDAQSSPDGRQLVCHFRAPDAESVRQLLRRAGIPFDRVWTGQ